MDRFMMRQFGKALFGVALIVIAGLAKLWYDHGTIWAPVLVLLGVLGVGAVIFALMLRAAKRWKREEYNRGMAEALGPYAAEYPETARYAKTGPARGATDDAVRPLVTGRDFIPFLEVNRDPQLWAHVAMGMNYDAAETYDVLYWIVDQPDCEAAIARDIWVQLNAVGMVSGDVNRGVRLSLPVAERIVIRSEGRGYKTGRLGSGFHDHSGLLAEAETALAVAGTRLNNTNDNVPLIDAPLTLLAMELQGPDLDAGAYLVDEEGLHGRPSEFNAPRGAAY